MTENAFSERPSVTPSAFLEGSRKRSSYPVLRGVIAIVFVVLYVVLGIATVMGGAAFGGTWGAPTEDKSVSIALVAVPAVALILSIAAHQGTLLIIDIADGVNHIGALIASRE